MRVHRVLKNLPWILAFTLAATSAGAADFAPITAEEKALTEVSGQPGAQAVVLFEKAEINIMNPFAEVFSKIEVQTRVKILSREGVAYGEVVIPHGDYLRLVDFEGRTVLPDGTAIPVAKEAIFFEKSSKAEELYLTKVAFPAVEPGVIIDYRYTLKWDDIFYLEPWTFHREIPVRLSEITYFKPDPMGVTPWGRETGGSKFHSESSVGVRGATIRIWMENLPALPSEPLSFPASDLASRFMLVPKEIRFSGELIPLLDSWETVVGNFEETGYAPLRRRGRKVKKHTRQMIAGIAEKDEIARVVYNFVRDEVRTDPTGWIYPMEKSLDDVLEERVASDAGKAILLQKMLEIAKIDAQLIWAADRRSGRIDSSVANPGWFHRMLVAVELGGETRYLDPVDPTLCFGCLSPHHEGTLALRLGPGEPEIVTLPTTAHEESTRRAEVDFALDVEGRLSAEGVLELAGHHAWLVLEGQTAEESVEKWREVLAGDWESFEIEDVEVEESIDERSVRVSWTMAEREVLGDEASFAPSRPLGPVSQPFELPATSRLTPVQLRFADRDEVVVNLSWPEGWELASLPGERSLDNETGAFEVGVELDEGERRLSLHRRFDVESAEYRGRENYEMLRQLYSEVEKSDAESVVLVRH